MSHPPVEQAVVTDARIDEAALMLDGVDTSAQPRFPVAEAAKFFFARTAHWIRWLESEGAFALDSGDVNCKHKTQEGPRVTSLVEDGRCTACGGQIVGAQRTGSGARTYSLSDIEKMAHALAQHEKINGAQLANTLLVVKTSAKIWGYLG